MFYVGGDLMMRRGMLPIIMLPNGDLRIVLHLVPFWILTISGSVHIEKTVVGWRNQLRMKTSAYIYVMTSSNGNIFRVTGPLWGESTGHRWIPRTKASDVELWYYLWSAPEQTIEQNNRDAADLRHHRAHYDFTVM